MTTKQSTKKTGNNSPHHKLNEEDVLKIRELLFESNLSLTRISQIFGVSYQAIQNIKAGFNWNY